jgi:hypothetical protein
MRQRDRPRSLGFRPPCDDHRAVLLYIPLAQAVRVRARLMNLLGANHVSHLRQVDDGWKIVICPKCAADRGQARAG